MKKRMFTNNLILITKTNKHLRKLISLGFKN